MILRARLVVAFALLAGAAFLYPQVALGDDGWTSGWPEGQPSDVITALLASPSAPGVAYAATSVGVYRSSNGGGIWHVLTGSLTNVSLLAASKSSPQTVYAHGSSRDAAARPTLWRSDDGGATWIDPAGGKTMGVLSGLSALLVDSGNPNVLLAGVGKVGDSYGRILKSQDGGANWRETYSVQTMFGIGQITTIVQAAIDPRILYAGHSAYHGGTLLRSTDGGDSWTRLPPPPDSALLFPASISMAPDDQQRVYAALQAPSGGGVQLLASKDSGQSWHKIGAGLPASGSSSPHLRADPINPRRLFVGLSGEGADVYFSNDRGSSWTLAGGNTLGARPVSALVIDSAGRQLYSGTRSGVWQLDIESIAPTVDPRFADYYSAHDGLRVLGRPVSGATAVNGFLSQYFEKGRIEDHSAETSDANWRFMYGLLVDDLQQKSVSRPVGGDVSSVSYADIGRLAASSLRFPAPSGLASGTTRNADGSVFVPFSVDLHAEPGHNVTARFWDYINRADLFPGGWLHDLGLPITEPVRAVADKGEVKGRTITIQAFQRAVLTDDPLNPPEWQIERANAGTDYTQAFLD